MRRDASRPAGSGAGSWRNPDPARTRVLYFGGYGRSGTTLLERILGQLPTFFSAGELIHLWERGLRGERCGCGAPFPACPVWSEVGRQAFGGWDNVDPERVLRLRQSVDRTARVPQLVAGQPAAYRRRLAEYVDILGRLYAAIGTVTGHRIVVDSSKHPSLAFSLRRVPQVDLRVVQVVRSSHGVAYSYTKQVPRPEITDRVELMPRYPPARTAAYWTVYNALFDALAALGVPRAIVRYERLVAAPRAELGRLLALTEQESAADALDAVLRGEALQLAATHTVAGNPMRFQHGAVRLRLDDEWRRGMSRRDRLAVTAAAWPMLQRFGYRLDGRLET